MPQRKLVVIGDGSEAPRLRALPPLRLIVGSLLAFLPWVNPFAYGPSPAVQPWLVSAVCALALAMLALRGARPRGPLVLLALVVVAWAALSQSAFRPETAMLTGGLALVCVAAAVCDDEVLAVALQSGLLIAAAASALFGLIQYFGASDLFAPWVNHAEWGEAFGNLRQPNQYATLCWLGAAVVLFGTLRLPRAAALGLVLLLAAGSAASVSRTGMLQGVLVTGLAVLWVGPSRRKRLLLCAAGLVAYLAAMALLPLLLEALTGALPARTLWARLGGGLACSSRMTLWSNVLHLIAQKPLTGWGWGELDYAHFVTLYPDPRFCDILDNAHNLPLHLAVELGIPAAVAICAGGLRWVARRRPWREHVSQRQLAWTMIGMILLHSMLEYPLWYGPFQIALGAALGWLAAPRTVPAQAASRRLPAIGAVLTLLAATSYAAWDYTRVTQMYVQPEERLAPWREDTLADVRKSWLFSGPARFAELTLQTVTPANAQEMYKLSREVLHYSPEPRVIERVIESAVALGRDDEALLYLARYRAAFPQDYAAWRAAHQRPLAP